VQSRHRIARWRFAAALDEHDTSGSGRRAHRDFGNFLWLLVDFIGENLGLRVQKPGPTCRSHFDTLEKGFVMSAGKSG
jgi:hypothetical protein